jgi:EAL domain-containing protein (putative c-di-GMP-specific phosphodiesterase class I)
LERAGRDICSRICIEITETEAITNLADAAAFIERVRSMGIKVALDDFGAGASSFGYLKSLRVDFMKIDGRFIRDLVTDKLNDVMVRCFVDIAKVVGVQTVAEFVETSETLDRLRIIGVDYAQGFLLGKPEPLARIFDVVPAVLEPT